MIRVIRRDYPQPDCLSVSFGYTKYQIVLGVPLDSPKTRYVSTGSQIARVRKRANSWVPLFRTLMESEGKGRGKLASDREGSVTCHMKTQFCFRVYFKVSLMLATPNEVGRPYFAPFLKAEKDILKEAEDELRKS
ncbi:protein Ycf2-like [Cucumis melo var. makuwa]|uniref:Protein Ycf2-like n=1 Tax=Cucumis melo var. makuwa TaxID=1194695 RepID=A0A5D3DDC0_CUCMM|nr:protein Ycf2-like [Cucumis melo var. makuwa]TYK21582.1 protein Ycf2-like [Cucumis melo var. makuwa]